MPDWIPADTQVTESAEVAEVNAQLAGAEATIDHLRESLADVQLALEDVGWQKLGLWGDQTFTRDGLAQAARLCRVMAVANPLIRRGLNLRSQYVWAGGVEIAARATGDRDGEQDVNAVVQDFLDDRDVRKVLTGTDARETNERALGTDGNVLFALFTNPRTGRVQPREIPFDEVPEKITNPEDRTDVWFYKRVWASPDGQTHTTYYPDIDYRPRGARPVRWYGNGVVDPGEVVWDAPVIHLKVNGLKGWQFGIGDAFTAINWARGYKEFLESWAKLMHALSRFAWRATSDRKSKAQAAAAKARAAVSATSTTSAPDPGEVGGLVSMGPGQSLEAIPKSGATLDSESGRPLAAMVAAGMDVPLTMLLADPGVTGARATAETLDTPTENMARLRRDVWSDFYRRLLDYVIDAAVKAPAGPLTGSVTRDEWDREVVDLGEGTSRTISIDWPDLTETSVDTLMGALEKADGIGKLPPLLVVRLVLSALKVKDADEWLAKVTGEDGEFEDPSASAGQAAVDDFRRGNDPAETVR